MKTLFLFLSIASFASITSHSSVAQNLVAHTPVSTAEQKMLDLAEQRNFNVLIDATEVRNETSITEVPQDTNAVNVFVRVAQQLQWDTLLFKPNTVLFWPEPDGKQIAQAVAQGQGYGAEVVNIKANELLPQLNEYLGKAGIEETAGVYKFKYSELSEELRKEIAAHVVLQTVSGPQRDYLELWQNDELWKHANIFYNPAIANLTGSKQTLFVTTRIQTAQGVRRLLLNLRTGGSSSSAEEDPVNNPKSPVRDDEIQILPLNETNIANPVVTSESLRPAGTAARQVGSSLLFPQLPDDEKLVKPLNIKELRIPLKNFLGILVQATGAKLNLAANIEAENKTLSVIGKDLPSRDAMLAVARLYGFSWNKTGEDSYELRDARISSIDKDLVRVGHVPWYRFRENNTAFLKEDSEEFNDLASLIVDEAAPEILQAPGIPLSSLSEETRQKIRSRPQRRISQRIIESQLNALNILGAEWSFLYKPSSGEFYVLQDRKMIAQLFLPYSRFKKTEPEEAQAG